MSSVKITFNEETLRNIPIVMSKYGFPKIAKEIKQALIKYIPQDTKSLLESFYITRDENDKWSLVGVGSKLGDDKVNIVAIVQHEKELRHYGEPGKSMRLGVGDGSVGQKWAIFGKSKPIPKVQLNAYHRGYTKLKKAGNLTSYKAEYLKKAVEETVAGFAKIIARQKLSEGNK